MNKRTLKKYLRKLGVKSISKKGDAIEIHVNSKGGNASDACQLLDKIQSSKIKHTIDIFQYPFL
jgi:ATP-dependent protease ClpP protease subunit